MALTVAELRYLFTADTRSLTAGFAEASAGLRRTARGSAMLTSAGGMMTRGFTLPVLAGAAAGVKLATDFQGSMGQIHALVGVSQKQVDAWSQQILQMGKTLPQSPKELADALYFVTSAGISTKDAMGVVQASAKAAAAGLGSTATVADAVSSAMNAYGSSALPASKATDVLTAAVREGKMEADQLAPAIGNVIPIASEMGVSFDQVAAAGASLSLTGLSAGEAMTSVRQMLQSIIKPSSQGAKALHSVGLSAGDVQRSLKEKGLLATLQMLKDKFHGNKTELSKVFGTVEGFNGVLALTGKNSAKVKDIFQKLKNSTGATDKAFKAASQTAASKFKQALSTLKAAGIQVGTALLPVLTKVANAVSDAIRWFMNLPGPVKQAIGVFAIVGATLGPLIFIIGKVGLAMAALRLGMTATSLTAAASGGPLSVFAFGIRAINAAIKANPIIAIITALVLLGTALVVAYKKSATFRRIVNAALHAVAQIARWLYQNIILPAFHGIETAFHAVAHAATWLWKNILAPAFHGIATVARWLWSHAIGPVFRLIGSIIRTAAHLISWLAKNIFIPLFSMIVHLAIFPFKVAIQALWKYVLKPTIHAIGDIIRWLWQHVIKPVFRSYIIPALKELGRMFKWVWEHVIKPAWHGLGTGLKWVWDHVIKPTFHWISKAVGAIGTAFKKAVDFIKRAWDKVKAITKAPVNFVIKYVYNKGIRWVWNKVANLVGAKELGEIPLLAAGGVFDKPTAIVGEGNTSAPEYVIPTDAKHRSRALGLYQSLGNELGVPMMASGGILGGTWNFLKKIGSGVASFVKHPLSSIKNAFSHIWKDLAGPVKAFSRSAFGKAIIGIPKKLIGSLVNKVKSLVSGLFGGGGADGFGGGPRVNGANQKIVREVFARHGWGSMWGATYRLLMRESGFRNTAQNPVSTAYGMFQFLNGTWGSVGGHKTSDPFLQAVYGARYIASKYGNPAAALRFHLAHNWYDDGGLARHEGVLLKRTNQPERVLSPKQTAAFERLVDYLDSGRGLSQQPFQVTVNAPQTMSPQQVGSAVGQRVAAAIGTRALGRTR